MPALHATTTVHVTDSAFPAVRGRGPRAALANAVLRLGDALGGPRLVASVAAIGHQSPDLTAGEWTRYRELASRGRRESWLAGRAAIKAARERLGLCTDTAKLRFPDACTSVTHAAGFAVAVAVAEGALRGLGVDLEAGRETSPEIGRFYLTGSERDWLERRPEYQRAEERIRLWTVKEAVYKACPDNADMTLSGIELDNPAAAAGQATAVSGRARRATTKSRISYASERTPAGWVSLALCRSGIVTSPA